MDKNFQMLIDIIKKAKTIRIITPKIDVCFFVEKEIMNNQIKIKDDTINGIINKDIIENGKLSSLKIDNSFFQFYKELKIISSNFNYLINETESEVYLNHKLLKKDGFFVIKELLSLN